MHLLPDHCPGLGIVSLIESEWDGPIKRSSGRLVLVGYAKSIAT